MSKIYRTGCKKEFKMDEYGLVSCGTTEKGGFSCGWPDQLLTDEQRKLNAEMRAKGNSDNFLKQINEIPKDD